MVDFIKPPFQGTGDSTPPVAVEQDVSADGVTTRDIQQMSLVNIAVEMRQMLTLIAQALSLAPDPATGRLRVLIDSVNSNVPVNIAGQTQPITIGFISTTTQGGNKPDTLVFDAMQNAWANSVYPCIARS